MVTNLWIEGFESTKDRVHDAETLRDDWRRDNLKRINANLLLG
jgi:hypothetical protein